MIGLMGGLLLVGDMGLDPGNSLKCGRGLGAIFDAASAFFSGELLQKVLQHCMFCALTEVYVHVCVLGIIVKVVA